MASEAPELVQDVLEPILIGFSLMDLCPLKTVCKSWYSLISSTRFHLNHLSYNFKNDNDVSKTKILMSSLPHPDIFFPYEEHDSFFEIDDPHLLGSCNGLVCISPFDTQVIVANPLTKVVNKLQNLPITYRESFCWGFGYDATTDDYKIVVGCRKGDDDTCFHVLCLKSNAWKVIGDVKYSFVTRSGVLWNGRLHWFMNDQNDNTVILSFDLSKEEFQETPQPNDPNYTCNKRNQIGVIKEGLWIFGCYTVHSPETEKYHEPKFWVMKNDNVKQCWELLPYNNEVKNDIAYSLKNLRNYGRIKKSFFNADICKSTSGEYMEAPLYVDSLVSPYVNGKPTKKRKRLAK